jgi:hypothetical protein
MDLVDGSRTFQETWFVFFWGQVETWLPCRLDLRGGQGVPYALRPKEA